MKLSLLRYFFRDHIYSEVQTFHIPPDTVELSPLELNSWSMTLTTNLI